MLQVKLQLVVFHTLNSPNIVLDSSLFTNDLFYSFKSLPLCSGSTWIIDSQSIFPFDHNSFHLQIVSLIYFINKHVGHGLGPFNRQIHPLDLFNCFIQPDISEIFLKNKLIVLNAWFVNMFEHIYVGCSSSIRIKVIVCSYIFQRIF